MQCHHTNDPPSSSSCSCSPTWLLLHLQHVRPPRPILQTLTDPRSPASSAFCKCTCFGNSTIIDLNGGTASTPGSDNSKKIDRTCNDCNKKLCLDYHLPICKGAEDEDVFTQCFCASGWACHKILADWHLGRDSAKDQAVVFIFIFATVGLLVFAGIRPWVDRWREVRLMRTDTGLSLTAHRMFERDAITFPYPVKASSDRHLQLRYNPRTSAEV